MDSPYMDRGDGIQQSQDLQDPKYDGDDGDRHHKLFDVRIDGNVCGDQPQKDPNYGENDDEADQGHLTNPQAFAEAMSFAVDKHSRFTVVRDASTTCPST